MDKKMVQDADAVYTLITILTTALIVKHARPVHQVLLTGPLARQLFAFASAAARVHRNRGTERLALVCDPQTHSTYLGTTFSRVRSFFAIDTDDKNHMHPPAPIINLDWLDQIDLIRALVTL